MSMKVKMKKLMAGPDGVVKPGEIITVSNFKGEALVNGGYAELIELDVQAHVPVETAEHVPEMETAVVNKSRKSNRRG
jgi:hypothetical protein